MKPTDHVFKVFEDADADADADTDVDADADTDSTTEPLADTNVATDGAGADSVTKPSATSSCTLRRAFTCAVIVWATVVAVLMLSGASNGLLRGYETPDAGSFLTAGSTAGATDPMSTDPASAAGPDGATSTCPHVLLFTAVRHGSTWLVDNVEHCAYSRDAAGVRTGSFGTLNRLAELWVAAQKGPLVDVSADRVPAYVVHNHSVKIFPFVWTSRSDEVRGIVRAVADARVPIVLLTRDERKVYQSLLTALESNVWNADTNGTAKHDAVDRPRLSALENSKAQAYYARLKKYFAAVRFYLDKQRLVYDQLDYDNVLQLRSIPLQNAACVIHNCNFAPFPVARSQRRR